MNSTIVLFAVLTAIAPAQATVPARTDCIYDYSMITDRECREYRARVLNARSEDERLALHAELRKVMETRARERDVPVDHWRGIEEASAPSVDEAPGVGGASIAILIAGLVALVAVALFVALTLWPVRRMRLMRCPETGTIAFVEVASVPGAAGKAGSLTVRSCELWPRQGHCASGCLERCEAAAPGLHVKIAALRPFEQP